MSKLFLSTLAITGITGAFYLSKKNSDQRSCCYFPRERDSKYNIFRIGTLGHTLCLIEYLRSGSYINQTDMYGDTLMHWAARHGNLEWGQLLVASSASIVNIKGDGGNTPLHLASYRNEDFVQFLISSGALVNTKNNEGFTPLHNAVIHQKKDIAEILLQAGANPEIKNMYGKTPYDT